MVFLPEAVAIRLEAMRPLLLGWRPSLLTTVEDADVRLTNLRLDDPELRREAVRSLQQERRFLARYRKSGDLSLVRKWARSSAKLGASWQTEEQPQIQEKQGLGHELRAAFLDLRLEAKRALEAKEKRKEEHKDRIGRVKRHQDVAILSSDEEADLLLQTPPPRPAREVFSEEKTIAIACEAVSDAPAHIRFAAKAGLDNIRIID
ncbi:unnamed protein product [Durusdinium trenchii]|uniref:Uncharacterized protein n=1 Tax=Durusdinium trenchii TaxID=1381693 RepID=A0ABP0HI86_9DINO